MIVKGCFVCIAIVLFVMVASVPTEAAKAPRTMVLPLAKYECYLVAADYWSLCESIFRAQDEFVSHRVKRGYTNTTFGGGLAKVC